MKLPESTPAPKYQQESTEVFYAADRIATVGRDDIDYLKKRAAESGRERSRLCTHRSTNDLLHEMFIVHSTDTYVRPHKHLGKAESFHLIEGRIDVIVFDENGAITDVVQMGEYSSGLRFYYRIGDPTYHTLMILSDVAVFHEVTMGPFVRDDTIYAPWSPTDDNKIACGIYRAEIAQMAKTFLDLKGRRT
jgi:cupin fold WbuC family metalloprotein